MSLDAVILKARLQVAAKNDARFLARFPNSNRLSRWVAVVRAEARDAATALVAEVTSLQSALAAKGAELQALVRISMFEKNPLGSLVDPAVSAVVARLGMPVDLWQGVAAEQAAGKAKWAGVVNALMADANATLPS